MYELPFRLFNCKVSHVHYPPTPSPVSHPPHEISHLPLTSLSLSVFVSQNCVSQSVLFMMKMEKRTDMEEYAENWGRKKERKKEREKNFEWYRERWGLVQKEGITVMITHSRYCWLVIRVLARAAFFSVSYPTLFMICHPPLVPSLSLSLSLSHQQFLHVLFKIQDPVTSSKPWF